MANSKKYIIMFLLVAGLGVLLYFLGEGKIPQEEKEERRVESINWEKNYDSENKHPYGTYFIRQILDRGVQNFSVEEMDVSVKTYFDSIGNQEFKEKTTYFFIGKSLNLYDSEVDTLLSFVAKGNNMFIAAEHLPLNLLETLFINYDQYAYTDYNEDSIVSLTFEENELSGEFLLRNEIRKKLLRQRWRYINYGVDLKYEGQNRGNMDSRPCYVEFRYGAGIILIHTVPQAFTNNFLKTTNGREYVEQALAYLPESTILFDNYTQYVYDDGLMEIDYGQPGDYSDDGRRLGGMNSLKFLLETPALRWGYFLILIGLVLFAIFRGKRQQKIIPTMESNNNSSLEFSETIARLYLSQNQHNKLIVHMKNIFINKIKNKYYIVYSDDAKYAERVAKKSGVGVQEIKKLMDLFKGGANTSNVSDEYLVNLYKKLNDFYKKAR